jgi:formylmethanofuran dehydrogenase subunit B
VTERALCIMHDPAFAELKAITAAVESQRKLLRDLAHEEAKLQELRRANNRDGAINSDLMQSNQRLQRSITAAQADLVKIRAQIKNAEPVAQAAAILEATVAMFHLDPIPCEAVMAGIELARAIRLQAKWSDEEADTAKKSHYWSRVPG